LPPNLNDRSISKEESTMSSQSGSKQGGNFPLDDLTFDLITILHEKSKGLEAYQKYLGDAKGDQEIARVIEQVMQQDQQTIQQLQQHLGRLLSQQGGSGRGAGGDVELSAASTGSGTNTGPTS
jgi:TolA-binding protein